MEKLPFELSNHERKYLGLAPVEDHWELVRLGEMYLYFDGDIIRKKISFADNQYREDELAETTAENRTILLPKTAKGKPKKLNFTATQSFSPFGVYFLFSPAGYISIANYTTQTTYYYDNLGDNKTLPDLKEWLDKWVSETTPADLEEIAAFSKAERKHCKYKEGDFFAFKIGRREWGFGRILMDVSKCRKAPGFGNKKHYGLVHLMGKPLIVKVYHYISDTPDVNLDELRIKPAQPSQAIMDNHFYYGEKPIIGNRPVEPEEEDMIISYGRSINYSDPDTVYLQYGMIYKETTISQFNRYLKEEGGDGGYGMDNPYSNSGVSFGLDIPKLRECIAAGSNDPYWGANSYSANGDLRNPANEAIKAEIFRFFGLDPDKGYKENLLSYEGEI